MKINLNVIEKFKFLCPTSTSKCSDESEIEYKITRAINLGRHTRVDKKGNFKSVEYHNLRFLFKNANSSVVNMWVLKGEKQGEPHYQVDEEIKLQYDLIHRKVPESVIEAKIVAKDVKSVNIIKLLKNKVSVYIGFLKLIFN